MYALIHQCLVHFTTFKCTHESANTRYLRRGFYSGTQTDSISIIKKIVQAYMIQCHKYTIHFHFKLRKISARSPHLSGGYIAVSGRL